MKKRMMAGTKVYWVAQSRSSVADRAVFRTRKEAIRFIDHRVEGWADARNSPTGWTVFECSAYAEHLP